MPYFPCMHALIRREKQTHKQTPNRTTLAPTLPLNGAVAPFKTTKDEEYLEPHHTRRIADGGPDHHRWVAAVCPNCHRRIHYGKMGRATKLS